MKVLSIDVGIKNLAYTILNQDQDLAKSNFVIERWDTINLCETVYNCSICLEESLAEKTVKKILIASFCKNGKYYCKRHTKNQAIRLPTYDKNQLNKLSIQKLVDICNQLQETQETQETQTVTKKGIKKGIKKTEIIEELEIYAELHFFDKIDSVNANNINLIDLGKSLKIALDKEFTCKDISNLDQIILENQISPLAGRMKTLQGMITQYFIDRGKYNIEFISATNKLKIVSDCKNKDGKKTTYSERKKLGIKYCEELLAKDHKLKIEYFKKHRKKDDLADCLLQGIYYLNLLTKN